MNLKMKTRSRIFTPVIALMLAFVTSMPAVAIERNPYFGLGAGVSKLSPDVGDSGLTLDEDSSTAVSLTLGIPMSHRFNAELGYSQLGTAELSGEDIEYSAFSLGAVAYVFGNEARVSNQPGLRAYVRLGLNIMDNETDIRLQEADNTAIWLGAGLEWPLSTRFGIRGELASFDGDAQALTLALLFQPGARQSRAPTSVSTPVVAPTAEVEPLPTPEPTIESQPEPEPEIVALPEIVPVPEPTVEPAVVTAPESGVLAGVEFETGTAILTSIGQGVLARLAESMQAYPGVSIEIGAHTDGAKGDANKLALTRSRAIAVARYLVSTGVPVQRMKARSFGANAPRAEGDSAGARRLNNRVEITVQ